MVHLDSKVPKRNLYFSFFVMQRQKRKQAEQHCKEKKWKPFK